MKLFFLATIEACFNVSIFFNEIFCSTVDFELATNSLPKCPKDTTKCLAKKGQNTVCYKSNFGSKKVKNLCFDLEIRKDSSLIYAVLTERRRSFSKCITVETENSNEISIKNEKTCCCTVLKFCYPIVDLDHCKENRPMTGKFWKKKSWLECIP